MVMQGSIYTAFSDMVVEKMGMQQWNDLLEEVNPASHGVYTSGQQYADSELIDMVVLLSEKTGIEVEKLVEAFGLYLFDKLYARCPVDISEIKGLRAFLLAIDNVIHVEVKRVHPQAYLPKFEYEDGPNNELIMYYSSKRKLCHASVGLIKGAALQFAEQVSISHPECMHLGHERCKLIIDFKG